MSNIQIDNKKQPFRSYIIGGLGSGMFFMKRKRCMKMGSCGRDTCFLKMMVYKENIPYVLVRSPLRNN